MSFDPKLLAVLPKPLVRLIEVIASGVGNVSRPYLTKKNANAKSHEIREIVQAIEENQGFEGTIEYNDGKIRIISPEKVHETYPGLAERAESRLDFRELRKQENLEAICGEAAEQLAEEQNVSEESPDVDWVTRFLDIAEGVSAEMLQRLWGKLLAGEIKNPGSYSLRTLDTLRNLSMKEAESFSKLCNYTLCTYRDNGLDKVFVVHTDPYLASKGVDFQEILSLKDAGLIFENDLEFSFGQNKAGHTSHLINGQIMLLFERTIDTPPVQCSTMALTKVGRELLQLVTVESDTEYLRLAAKTLQARGMKHAWAPIEKYEDKEGNVYIGAKTYFE